MAPRRVWDWKSVVDALFLFYKERGYWPGGNYAWRSMNGLPSPWTITRLVNPRYYSPVDERGAWTPEGRWRSPWDVFQREIAKDERCTAEMAFKLPNALARKEAIERIGFEKIIATTKDARLIDSHEKFGSLYQLPAERPDQNMHIVKVVNSTAEPDGTFAEYFLRVPPFIWKVQEAVAWTFGIDRRSAKTYWPLAES